MDGNGRWAESAGLPRVAGHRAGAEAVRKALEGRRRARASKSLRSTPSRPRTGGGRKRRSATSRGCCAIISSASSTSLSEKGVRLRLIGDHAAFGPELVERLERAVERTAGNDRLTLVVALNYGSRAEIAAAARRLADKAAAGELDPAAIDEAALGARAADRATCPSSTC